METKLTKSQLLSRIQSDVAALIALEAAQNPTPEPVPPTPVTDVLANITKAGTRFGSAIYELDYGPYPNYVEIPSESPKQVVFRGTNLPGSAGVVMITNGRLTGNATGNGGMDEPAGIGEIPGYTRKFYPDDKRAYYEQNSKQGATKPIVKPEISTNSGPQPDPDKETATETIITD